MEKMINKTALLAVLCLLGRHAFSEAVDWTGKNFGQKSAPSWIVNFVEKKNDKKLRKKFDFSDTDRIFFGSARHTSKEYAKMLAEVDAVRKVKELISMEMKQKDTDIDALNIFGLEQFYYYWEEDGNGLFKIYIFYFISNENFEKTIRLNTSH